MSGDHNQHQKDKSYLDGMDRYKQVRELVKDLSLRVTEIAWKTGYNKGHVSRLRKEAMRQALETEQEPVAWRYKYPDGFWRFSNGERVNGSDSIKSQALYTAPPKKEWVGLTDEEVYQCEQLAAIRYQRHKYSVRGQIITPADGLEWHFAQAIEAKLKEKNT